MARQVQLETDFGLGGFSTFGARGLLYPLSLMFTRMFTGYRDESDTELLWGSKVVTWWLSDTFHS